MKTYPSHKSCNLCGEVKLLDEFYKQSNGRYGRQSYCKICERGRIGEWRKKNAAEVKKNSRLSYVKRTYNLSKYEYEAMLESQRRSCSICGAHEDTCVGKVLYVDHCHSSGRVRALLCHNCNSGLGNFKDNTELLETAKRYLLEHSA